MWNREHKKNASKMAIKFAKLFFKLILPCWFFAYLTILTLCFQRRYNVYLHFLDVKKRADDEKLSSARRNEELRKARKIINAAKNSQRPIFKGWKQAYFVKAPKKQQAYVVASEYQPPLLDGALHHHQRMSNPVDSENIGAPCAYQTVPIVEESPQTVI